MDSRVRINIHSRLRRPVDPDGISPKACIDGIVQGHLLPNDTAKIIKGLSFTQEDAKEDETIIDIFFE